MFSAQELARVTQPFTGAVTFDRLQAARNASERLDLDRQYLTSGAYIPTGQTLSIDEAVVRIQIVEGKLEDIQVIGTQRLNPAYIRSRLAFATRQPLNNNLPIEGLRLLQQDPLIGSIAAELSTGIQPGTNLLEIKVTENKTFQSEITTNSCYAEVSVRHPLLRRARQDSTPEFALSLTGLRLESMRSLLSFLSSLDAIAPVST